MKLPALPPLPPTLPDALTQALRPRVPALAPQHALATSVTFGIKTVPPVPRNPLADQIQPRPTGSIPFLSEKRRVDLMLIPAMLWRVFAMGASDPDHREAHVFRALLADAMVEPLNGHTHKVASKLTNRANKLARDLCDEFFSGMENAKVCAIIFYTTQQLLQEGVIVLYDGSAMADALIMTVGFFDYAVQEEAVDKSAHKQARKFAATLKERGFFA